MKTTPAIGTRVRVRIANPDAYAMGCAASLDGKTGAIERVKELTAWEAASKSEGAGLSTFKALVAFDTPAPKWWAHQSPCTGGFWFPLHELEEE